NGYKGFYCMKYEINLGQYVDFLNCLIPSGLDANFYTDPAIDFGHDCSRIKRYSIYFDDSLGQYVTNNPALPHEYVGWGDCMAYADWAALRPMSELEFEKVCRGPADSFEPIGLNYDYAYGVHEPVNEEYELALLSGNSTGEFDSVTNYDPQTANLVYRGSWFKYDFCEDEEGTELIGFMRNGVFANMATMRGDSLTRINTGGTYYGVMEMSGNLNERCVGISERWRSSSIDADTLTEDYDWPLNNTPSCGSTGISFEVLNMKGIKYYYKDCPSVFTGVNGDGELGADGKADVTGWPKEGKGGAPGSIIRGGRWNQIKERCYTADRLSLTGATARTHESTIRFVRTF
ncbi:MAG: SUMF1/EgtB/PvdO family nonheme iron enzyme, partial [Chitinophagales bacterium]